VSEMGARMVNELNSPLSIVGNYINGCMLRLSPENDSSKMLMTALKKAAAALDTTFDMLQKMKNFNSRRSLSWKKININDFIKDTILLFNFEISSYPVRIYFNPNHECGIVNIDQDQMQQVLLNLTRNALEAMMDAKTIQPRIFKFVLLIMARACRKR
jgi:two-component system sensor kinase FixL